MKLSRFLGAYILRLILIELAALAGYYMAGLEGFFWMNAGFFSGMSAELVLRKFKIWPWV